MPTCELGQAHIQRVDLKLAQLGHDGLSFGSEPGGLLISRVRSCAFSAAAACRGKDADENRADV